MLIPHLHFCGTCKDAISLYEKAFHAKTETLITSREPGSTQPDGENHTAHAVAHAVMNIHGQQVFMNDRFGKKDHSTDVAVHLIVTFESKNSLMACYEIMKQGSYLVDPLETLPYSPLAVQFIDKFGVQWGFMAEEHGEES